MHLFPPTPINSSQLLATYTKIFTNLQTQDHVQNPKVESQSGATSDDRHPVEASIWAVPGSTKGLFAVPSSAQVLGHGA